MFKYLKRLKVYRYIMSLKRKKMNIKNKNNIMRYEYRSIEGGWVSLKVI